MEKTTAISQRAPFPGVAGPVFLLFNNFADGVHALDKAAELIRILVRRPSRSGRVQQTRFAGVNHGFQIDFADTGRSPWAIERDTSLAFRFVDDRRVSI